MPRHKWEWINTEPGVLALSGTPIQIRRNITQECSPQGFAMTTEWFGIYEDNNLIDWAGNLPVTKDTAEGIVNDRLELGLLKLEL